ncbi:MAG: hypothetical protein ABIO60_06880 [Aquaticitalea sp.]
MKTTETIIDTTLAAVGNSMNTIDSTFERIPVYKAGHMAGGAISKWIDRLVDEF